MGDLVGQAPQCCGVRGLRAGTGRRKENILGGGGRKPRVRWCAMINDDKFNILGFRSVDGSH